MTRHGFSHATATLVTVVVAPVLSDLLRSSVPIAMPVADRGAVLVAGLLGTYRPLSPAALSNLLIAAVLAFVWGVAFAAIQRAR